MDSVGSRRDGSTDGCVCGRDHRVGSSRVWHMPDGCDWICQGAAAAVSKRCEARVRISSGSHAGPGKVGQSDPSLGNPGKAVHAQGKRGP